MKRYILFALLFFSRQIIAQTTDLSSKKNEKIIKNDFSKIDPKKFSDLIPYSQNGKWGFIDKFSKKLVVPITYSSLQFFSPNMINGNLNETVFYIDNTGQIHIGEEGTNTEEVAELKTETHFDGPIKPLPSKDGFRGFSVNEYNEVTALSDIYPETWYSTIVKIKNQVYAIVKKKNYFGIIDTLGNALKGFDFSHKKIEVNYYADDKENVWFFVQNDDSTWSAQNEKGEIRCKNEILENPYPTEIFGLTIISNKKAKEQYTSGIFDCAEMKWVVPPQNKWKIDQLDYTSTEILDKENPSDKKKATIYFRINNQGIIYYADLMQNIYNLKK